MKNYLTLMICSLVSALLLFSPVAHAAASCEAQAVSKDGKPLSGAAKAASIKKCEAETKPGSTCEGKAIDKNGKLLAGAAKTAFMKKCEAEEK